MAQDEAENTKIQSTENFEDVVKDLPNNNKKAPGPQRFPGKTVRASKA